MRRLAVLAGVATAVAVAAAIAYATIPGGNGVISACYDKQGHLRVVDAEAGASCRPHETPLAWNQRPSAAQQFAYARIERNGTLDQERSSGVLGILTFRTPGGPSEASVLVVCFDLVFVPKNVTMAQEEGSQGNATVRLDKPFGTGDPITCAAPYRDAVATSGIRFNEAGDGFAFYVLFTR